MSRSALPDLLGLAKLQENGNPPVKQRFIMDLRGDVEVEDNPEKKRIDLRIGPVAVIRPPTITANDSAYNPPGFATCRVVMLTSTQSGVQITPLADPDVIITINRTWINVGSVAIELVFGAETHLLLPNYSAHSIFDKFSEAWVLQSAPGA